MITHTTSSGTHTNGCAFLVEKVWVLTQIVWILKQSGEVIPMDMKKLEEYRSNVAEREDLRGKIARLNSGEDDSCIGNSVIMDYRTGYPRPQSVVGYDFELELKRRARWANRLEKLEADINEVEAWIEAIPDGVTRRCFRMYYMDGLSQIRIAKRLHLDRSRVSRKMSDFLKNAHKAQKAQL